MPETLTITDNRTGRSFDVPIEDGAIRTTALREAKITEDDFGLMSYDPAFLRGAPRSGHRVPPSACLALIGAKASPPRACAPCRFFKLTHPPLSRCEHALGTSTKPSLNAGTEKGPFSRALL
jgi:hypothetical protein